MTVRWVLLGVMIAAVAGYASAEPVATGLTGLEDKLSSTGRIGAYAPQSSSQIAPGVAPPRSESDSASRAPRPVSTGRALNVPADRRGGLAEEELTPTDGRVTACRLEVG